MAAILGLMARRNLPPRLAASAAVPGKQSSVLTPLLAAQAAPEVLAQHTLPVAVAERPRRRQLPTQPAAVVLAEIPLLVAMV